MIIFTKKIINLTLLFLQFFLFHSSANCFDKSFYNKQNVQNLLSDLVLKDQNLRSEIDFSHLDNDLLEKIEEQNRHNTQILKQILNIYYWIKIPEFSEEADEKAWLLVQHADHDVQFQKEVLKRLEKLLSIKETNPRNFAYLYDRIACNEKRLQRYGTQGKIENNQWILYDTEDLTNLDERRKAMLLPPYAEYLKQISQLLKI